MVKTNVKSKADTMDPGSDTTNRKVVLEAGPLKFSLRFRDLNDDQGVSIEVSGNVKDQQIELLRFDCFDQTPHYHYAPGGRNERHNLDKVTSGNPLGWTLTQLRSNLVPMLVRSGADDLVDQLDQAQLVKTLGEVEACAREMAQKQRSTVTHNHGTEIIKAGNIRFGLEFRELSVGRGLAIHVLGDVAGQEIELLAFDCFDRGPHYHYGPRNKNIRLYWDQTIVPDTLRWTLDQFKQRKLSEMIGAAGYPGIVQELDLDFIDAKLPEIEAAAMSMVQKNN